MAKLIKLQMLLLNRSMSSKCPKIHSKMAWSCEIGRDYACLVILYDGICIESSFYERTKKIQEIQKFLLRAFKVKLLSLQLSGRNKRMERKMSRLEYQLRDSILSRFKRYSSYFASALQKQNVLVHLLRQMKMLSKKQYCNQSI